MHTQTPLVHFLSNAEALPHKPQLSLSVKKWRQAPSEQRACPPSQLLSQTPPLHTCPCAQAVPEVPLSAKVQLVEMPEKIGLVMGSMHFPKQITRGASQPAAHLPRLHT
jgi:hypothetical protein